MKVKYIKDIIQEKTEKSKYSKSISTKHNKLTTKINFGLEGLI
jgi:hypothetical protein